MMAVLGFVAVLALVTGLIHLYLWKRLVRDTTTPGRWRRIGGIAALVLALLVPVTLAGTQAGLYWLAWPGYLWLALMFYLLVVLVVLEVPMLVTRLVLRRRVVAAEPTTAAPEPVLVGAAGPTEPPAAGAVAAPDHDPSRRLLLARGAAIFAGLTATGVTGYGIRTALGPPQLDRVRIPLAKLPRSMDGLRIATVSDIHLGPLRGRAHTERIVAAINRLDADIVAVVGDLVDGSVAELGSAAAPLRDLRSRYGSFFVTGNHEYYSGVEEWVQEVDRLGLRVLQNRRQEIQARGGVLDLAGVNDLTGAGTGLAAGPDFAAALGDRDPSRPVVLLAHQPLAAKEAARYGVDLQLSGHTHGGQMVPFNLAVGLEQPVVSGLGEVDGTKVYVTNGAGFWGPPVRVGAEPQISLVELRSA
ncbi:Transmembrane protein with metallophosphoesteras e domain [Micromonospora saelicesensis]|uniref:Transmembrane protein with metallophosphoesteras e domain n=1 Tax=Micromonospora saelicesensis TaxID=285676 RepID=A0ABX9CHE6_9ACTN|nr:metallophosphoesterase [Micromonospora saelicesensis]RAN97220.1 Transmembrane protein with metallophosphoesteras e domain [Micromonospora saelicesensis]RAO48249.1 Transmembrane protein with metallophosphoesteras e domain [Micromonospora saelicesensis]RAO49634.1 Transmembrane protein with metallophosphoesteras e domain [Micromonospora saelicesensis]